MYSFSQKMRDYLHINTCFKCTSAAHKLVCIIIFPYNKKHSLNFHALRCCLLTVWRIHTHDRHRWQAGQDHPHCNIPQSSKGPTPVHHSKQQKKHKKKKEKRKGIEQESNMQKLKTINFNFN